MKQERIYWRASVWEPRCLISTPKNEDLPQKKKKKTPVEKKPSY